MLFSTIVVLSALPFVFCQSTNDTGLEIEAIEAHFDQSGIVPSLLSSFDPDALLTVTYPGIGAISPGQPLQEEQVAPTPVISITPANSSVSLTGNFTLAMVDADKVGTDESGGVTRHWLVNFVTISGTTLSNTSAVVVTQYGGPAPPPGSGAHRYVILLYTQPEDFHPPAEFSGTNIGISKFNLTTYVQDSGLVGPIAGMYYTVENGTAIETVSATSPVQSSTLAPVKDTSTGTGTGTGSGSQPTKTPGSASSNKQFSSLVMLALGVILLA